MKLFKKMGNRIFFLSIIIGFFLNSCSYPIPKTNKATGYSKKIENHIDVYLVLKEENANLESWSEVFCDVFKEDLRKENVESEYHTYHSIDDVQLNNKSDLVLFIRHKNDYSIGGPQYYASSFDFVLYDTKLEKNVWKSSIESLLNNSRRWTPKLSESILVALKNDGFL